MENGSSKGRSNLVYEHTVDSNPVIIPYKFINGIFAMLYSDVVKSQGHCSPTICAGCKVFLHVDCRRLICSEG